MPYGHNRSPVCGRNLPPFCEASRVDAFHGSLLTENGEQHDDTQRTVGYPEIWQVAPAGAGPDLYGRHLQSAICLDAVDKTPGRQTWRRSARIAGHLLAADHPADLLFPPFQGAVSGKIWPTAADRYWHSDGGNELGAFRAGEWPRQRSGWFMAAWAASGPGSSTSALSA